MLGLFLPLPKRQVKRPQTDGRKHIHTELLSKTMQRRMTINFSPATTVKSLPNTHYNASSTILLSSETHVCSSVDGFDGGSDFSLPNSPVIIKADLTGGRLDVGSSLFFRLREKGADLILIRKAAFRIRFMRHFRQQRRNRRKMW